MSELIDRIREQTEHAHDDAEGYFTAAEIRELLAEIDRLRAKNTELNRRCTKAERFVGKSIDELRTKGPVTFGRALANLAAETERRRVEELEQELAALRAEAARD